MGKYNCLISALECTRFATLSRTLDEDGMLCIINPITDVK